MSLYPRVMDVHRLILWLSIHCRADESKLFYVWLCQIYWSKVPLQSVRQPACAAGSITGRHHLPMIFQYMNPKTLLFFPRITVPSIIFFSVCFPRRSSVIVVITVCQWSGSCVIALLYCLTEFTISETHKPKQRASGGLHPNSIYRLRYYINEAIELSAHTFGFSLGIVIFFL